MFDTSLVRSGNAAASRRLGVFSASLAIHSAVVVAAISASIANVEFPAQAPDQFDVLRPVTAVTLPPPLGDGQPPAKREALPPPVKKEPAAPAEVVAPREVPADVPILETPAVATDPGATLDTASAGESTETGSGTGGSPDGVAGGMGNDPNGVIGVPGDGGPRVPGGEVRAAKVVRRVEPRYPTAMIPARIKTAVVTVRCVVDRNGRVRDPQVLTSSWPAFNDSVLDAVSRWTFTPGTLHGQPVDTWFELTVRFQVR